MIPPDVREAVLRRDGYRCIAPTLDPDAGPCKNRWGHTILRWSDRDPGGERIEMSHTKAAGELMMSKKAATDPDHLVSLCPHHHRATVAGSNWEARFRDEIRAYLGLS